MKKIKIIIVEDEVLIMESLKIMLQKMDYEVTGTYHSGNDFLSDFEEGRADLILMDIYLADSNGVETGKILAKISKVPIIYLTDNTNEKLRKKAIFETNASYYLGKPYTYMALQSAIELSLKKQADLTALDNQKDIDDQLLNDSIFIKDGAGFKVIKLMEIEYLKADGSYCLVKCADKEYIFSENLSFFEDKLDFSKTFVRVHRSYIVNINLVEKIWENNLFIKGIEIPIGKTYKENVLRKFRFF